MKEHPILFSTEMVQAILESRKTQTRRVVIPQPSKATVCFKKSMSPIHWQSRLPVDLRALFPNSNPMTILGDIHKCPYGRVGDRLWVRETWGYVCSVSSYHGRVAQEHYAHIRYLADGTDRRVCFATSEDMREALPKQNLKKPDNFDTLDEYQKEWTMSDLCTNWWKKQKVKPSIFMPRWASRITLEITDIRVERLQEITEEDAVAESIMPEQHPFDAPPAMRYAALWNSINGNKHSWESNPWVWVIEFKKI